MDKTKLVLWLLAFNVFGSLVWLLGWHQFRLLLLSMTGTILFTIFFLQKDNNKAGLLFKAYLLLQVLRIGFNLMSYELPNMLMDLSAFGIVTSTLSMKNIHTWQVKRAGLYLCLTGILYFLLTLPMIDFKLLFSGSFNRDDAFSAVQGDVVGVNISKAYVIYSTHQLIVSFFILFFMLIPLFYNKLGKSKMIILVLSSVSLIVFYAAYYQKRQALLELGVITILVAIFYRKSLKGFLPKKLLISIVFSSLLIYTVLSFNIMNNVMVRFSEGSKNIENFDRIEESAKVLSSFNAIEWIFGKGLGYSAPDTAGGSILHIGYSNLLMKGGLVLLLFYLIYTFKNLYFCARNAKYYPEYNVGIVISIFSLIQLSYAPGYHWFISTIITGLAMFSRFPLNNYIYNLYHDTKSKNRNIRHEEQKNNLHKSNYVNKSIDTAVSHLT